MVAEMRNFGRPVEELTPEQLESIKACMRSNNEFQRSLFGMALGAAVTIVPLSFVPNKIAKTKATTLVLVGAVYGYLISHFVGVKNCLNKVFNEPNTHFASTHMQTPPVDSINMYENRKSRLENQEVVKAETTTREPMNNLLDDFTPITESEDVQDNKEAKQTLTYKELRERNREAYRSTNSSRPIFPLWARDKNKEQPVQVKEFDTETKEPNFFPDQSTGKHKTKYGDVWD